MQLALMDLDGANVKSVMTPAVKMQAWRQLAQSWKVDAGYAQSMMIVFGEDVGHSVLGMDSSSAESLMARRGTGRIRTLTSSYAVVTRACGLWRGSRRETKGRAQHGRHRQEGGDCSRMTTETSRNVQDGVWR